MQPYAPRFQPYDDINNTQSIGIMIIVLDFWKWYEMATNGS